MRFLFVFSYFCRCRTFHMHKSSKQNAFSYSNLRTAKQSRLKRGRDENKKCNFPSYLRNERKTVNSMPSSNTDGTYEWQIADEQELKKKKNDTRYANEKKVKKPIEADSSLFSMAFAP